MPPLRDRVGDILPLALELLSKHGHGKADYRFDQAAIAKLLAYQWPGNVRELENVMQRALILCTGNCLTADDLLFETDDFVQLNQADCVQTPIDLPVESTYVLENSEESTLQSLGDGVRSAEEKIILQILNEARGNRKTTAEKLGISPRTLRYKIARMKEAGVFMPC